MKRISKWLFYVLVCVPLLSVTVAPADALTPNQFLESASMLYPFLDSAEIQCTRIDNHPADRIADKRAKYEFADSKVFKIPYTPQAIQEWIEARQKPYSQTYDVVMRLCGRTFVYEQSSGPGIAFPHGTDLLDLWNDDTYISIDRQAKLFTIEDMNEFSSQVRMFRPNPKLLCNPAAFLLENVYGGEPFKIAEIQSSDGFLRLKRGDKVEAIIRIMEPDGFIASREAQILMPGGTSIMTIIAEGSIVNSEGISVFPKEVHLIRRIFRGEQRNDQQYLNECLQNFISEPDPDDYSFVFDVESAIINTDTLTEASLYPEVPSDFKYRDKRIAVTSKASEDGERPVVGTGPYDYLTAAK